MNASAGLQAQASVAERRGVNPAVPEQLEKTLFPSSR